MISSGIPLTCIPYFGKSFMMCYLFHIWLFRFVLSSPTTTFFLRKYYVFVIHDWVMHLTRAVQLLDNMVPVNTIFSLCPYIKSWRCIPVINSLLPNLIKSFMYLWPCVKYRELLLSPSWEAGPVTNFSLGVLQDIWCLWWSEKWCWLNELELVGSCGVGYWWLFKGFLLFIVSKPCVTFSNVSWSSSIGPLGSYLEQFFCLVFGGLIWRYSRLQDYWSLWGWDSLNFPYSSWGWQVEVSLVIG